MFLLSALGLGALAAGAAAWLATHDAQEWKWYPELGYRPIRKLVTFDLTVALVTYLALTALGGAGWGALAAVGVVPPQTEAGGQGSLLFCAITAAGGGGLALVTARVPAGTHPPLLKRLSNVRGRYLKEIRSHAEGRQTEDHVYNRLPGLRALVGTGTMELEVQAWTAACEMSEPDAGRLMRYVKAGDDESLLAFAASVCSYDGGRAFLTRLAAKGVANTAQRAPGGATAIRAGGNPGAKASGKTPTKRKGSAQRQAPSRKRRPRR